jgi:hypothetical protein
VLRAGTPWVAWPAPMLLRQCRRRGTFPSHHGVRFLGSPSTATFESSWQSSESTNSTQFHGTSPHVQQASAQDENVDVAAGQTHFFGAQRREWKRRAYPAHDRCRSWTDRLFISSRNPPFAQQINRTSHLGHGNHLRNALVLVLVLVYCDLASLVPRRRGP